MSQTQTNALPKLEMSEAEVIALQTRTAEHRQSLVESGGRLIRGLDQLFGRLIFQPNQTLVTTTLTPQPARPLSTIPTAPAEERKVAKPSEAPSAEEEPAEASAVASPVVRTVDPTDPYYKMGVSDGKNGNAPQGVADPDFNFQYQAGYEAGHAAKALEEAQPAATDAGKGFRDPIDDPEERVKTLRRIAAETGGYISNRTIVHARDLVARPAGSIDESWCHWAVACDSARRETRERLDLERDEQLPEGLGSVIDAMASAVVRTGIRTGSWDQTAANEAYSAELAALMPQAEALREAELAARNQAQAATSTVAATGPTPGDEAIQPPAEEPNGAAKAALADKLATDEAARLLAIAIYRLSPETLTTDHGEENMHQMVQTLHPEAVKQARAIAEGAPSPEARHPLVRQWVDSLTREACNIVAVQLGYASYATVRDPAQRTGILELTIYLVGRNMNQNDPIYKDAVRSALEGKKVRRSTRQRKT